MLKINGLLAIVGCLAFWGCSFIDHAQETLHPASQRSIIAKLRSEVQDAVSPFVGEDEKRAIEALRGAQFFPAEFKRPLTLQGLTDPWGGFAALEGHGMLIEAGAAQREDALFTLLDELEAGMNRPSPAITTQAVPAVDAVEDHLAFLLATLAQAQALRDQALHRLGPDDRQFLYEHAAGLVENFSPQRSWQSAEEMAQAKRDLQFMQLVDQRMDYGALAAAAKLLAHLDNDQWFRQLQISFRGRQPVHTPVDGVTGELLWVHQAPAGLIVIGGPGPNTYDLDQRFAVVIDVGGDDTYRGAIAAASSVEQGVNVVIDLSGDDRYDASPLGLATGRLGVGLLIERSGDDRYHFAPGSGGTGFAGVGILHDRSGRDQYEGSRLTQGAAVGGLGLLLDHDGDDTYTSFGYGIGFGGPLGVGAVIDVSGHDSYYCGETYPSRYNDTDAPNGRPGDPRYQYDAFGIGAGVGVRIVSRNPEHLAYGLAGGLGLAIDLDGDDRYRSSNFSQGVGYFFGMGVKLDLRGNDVHAGARYGHGAAAHYGVGLFLDRAGDDRYTSTGPFYNGGTAWDLSVSLCVDAGDGHDLYDLRESDGLGRADHRSWSFFIDEGGRDRYVVPHGMGAATDRSVSGFLDLAGEDDYVMLISGQSRRGNGQAFGTHGSVFVDR